jgi:hypothetical protein
MWNQWCLFILSLHLVSLSRLTFAWLTSSSELQLQHTAYRRLEPSYRSRIYSIFPQENEAERLLQQAEKLRKEIDSFEQKRLASRQENTYKDEQEQAAQAATRERYSAVVPILKPDGTTVHERCDFTPRCKDGTSFITACTSNLPLGILLGEGEEEFVGAVIVDEVGAGSNGEQGRILPGDIVRAVTACKMEMELPTWQLIVGGIGVPKTKRFMYSVDGRPFEEVMDAITSNRMDPEQRPVLLVVERRETP